MKAATVTVVRLVDGKGSATVGSTGAGSRETSESSISMVALGDCPKGALMQLRKNVVDRKERVVALFDEHIAAIDDLAFAFNGTILTEHKEEGCDAGRNCNRR